MDNIPESDKRVWSKIGVTSLNGISKLNSCKSIKPLKIMNPRNISDCCQVYLSNYGGGFVAGDEIYIEIECMPYSKLYIGTQAETKIYRSFDGRTCSQTIHGRLHPHSLAVICPDALIPYRGSHFTQKQIWHMDSTSALVLVDWLHAGRSALGEDFQYVLLGSEIQIVMSEKKLILDRLRIVPENSSHRLTGAFGPYKSSLTLYLIGRPFKRLIQMLEILVDETSGGSNRHSLPCSNNRKIFAQGYLWVALNRINSMCYVLRALAKEKADILSLLEKVVEALECKDLLGFNPLTRKY